MYLHLGQDVVVRQRDIIGIFDIENATIKKSSKDFLSMAQKTGKVVNVSEELPKTFIVCCENKETIVYISQISSATLHKRMRFIEDIEMN